MKPNTALLSVKAVCFDLDGTLYEQLPLQVRMASLLLKAWCTGGVTFQDLRVLRCFRKNRELARKLGRTPDLDARVLARTAQQTGCSTQNVADLVNRWIRQAPLSVLSNLADSQVHQMLQRLRLRGYRLGILSDYPASAKLEALGLPLRLFDAIVETGEPPVSALKPHTEGFLEVSRKLGLTPEEVLYVGDRDSVDGVGARSVGMPFALCRPYGLLTPKTGFLLHLRELESYLSSCRDTGYPQRSEGCWLCGGSKHTEFAPSRIPVNPTSELVKITDSQYGVTAGLLRCTDCGFIYAERESARAIERLYEGMVDPEYQCSTGSRRRSFAGVLRQIQRLRPSAGTLLDVGAGLGAFCLEAEQASLQVEGVEPSAWAVAEGRRQHGITIHQGYFPHPHMEGKKFDIITLLDVIEHVSQPIELLRACHRCLANGGLLVIVTPDIGSLVARLMGARWWHLRPAHIGYFTRETMTAALGAAGFSVEFSEAYTWWFPATYILQRLERYLPIGFLNRILMTPKMAQPLARIQVPIRLGDSHVYFARAIEVIDAERHP